MSVPTRGETFSKLLEHLRLAQEDAAMMAHLENADRSGGGGPAYVLAKGWLNVSEQLKKMQHLVTEFAKQGLQ